MNFFTKTYLRSVFGLSIFIMGHFLSAAEHQPVGSKETYINWLEEQSMLHAAGQLSKKVSGSGIQWQHPYAMPQTEKVVARASVWFTAYPPATITRAGQSVLQALGDPALWNALQETGIQAMHTGPVKRAGGIQGYQSTPTVDGWFDRISLNIDPLFGTDADYQRMVKTAAQHSAIIIGDVIPGHTGKGADFRLAELGYKDYPGLYDMVAIREEDWSLLPDVPEGNDSVTLPADTVDKLKEKGYITGQLQRVLFSVPGKPGVTGWDATDAITGADGRKRRWVYLHYFRPGQPTLNWLDPSFAANRLIAGDIIKTKLVLGATIIRLDANPFLGIEMRPGSKKSWSEGHPLSVVASDIIAWTMRKLGGWSFQELNMGIEEIKGFSKYGPDLSYDFITRPAYNHALLTGDASFLRLCLRLMREYEIRPIQMIHALQNHDEITYELVHFAEHAEELFEYHNKKITGQELRAAIIKQMHELALGARAPYNQLSGNGLCTTYAGFCAAALGIKDPYSMLREDIERVKKGHLLMAMFNAMQPGVFAISGWDLVGALPLPTDKIPELVADGDYRWVNRGAYDLAGLNPQTLASPSGLPKAQTIYGALADQLKDKNSFASQLKRMLAIRKKYKLALAEQLAIPDLTNNGLVVMIHRLPEKAGIEMTALNFGRKPVRETVMADELKGLPAYDLYADKPEGKVSDSGEFLLNLDALQGKVLLFSSSRD